jgi:hypothetical protein
VDEFAANAALGDTCGGTVNITTKSGANQYHGSSARTGWWTEYRGDKHQEHHLQHPAPEPLSSVHARQNHLRSIHALMLL